MKDDPIVAEIRATRKAISAKFNHNLEAIFADARRRQNASGRMVVRMPRKPAKTKATPAIKPSK